jgi:hypothetical protein
MHVLRLAVLISEMPAGFCTGARSRAARRFVPSRKVTLPTAIFQQFILLVERALELRAELAPSTRRSPAPVAAYGSAGDVAPIEKWRSAKITRPYWLENLIASCQSSVSVRRA